MNPCYKEDEHGQLNESSVATAVGETPSGHGWSVYIRRAPRRLDAGNLVTGSRVGAQDESGQQGVAAQTTSDPGQGDGGVLEALGHPARAIRGTT